MDYEEYKRKALEPIVNYIESVMTSYSKEELEARIKKALPERESEDELIRKRLINLIKELAAAKLPIATSGYFVDGQDKKYIAYLEKQKEPLTPEEKMNHPLYLEGFDVGRQVGEVVAKPAEWSEEEEKMRRMALECLDHISCESKIPVVNWLKFIRPQPHWKPSEEQIEALERCVDYLDDSNNEDAEVIGSLCHDLKKVIAYDK